MVSYGLRIEVRARRLRWWGLVLLLPALVLIRIADGGSTAPSSGPGAKTTIGFTDTGSSAAVGRLWGEVACESDARVKTMPRGGDPRSTGNGDDQGNGSFRRLRVIDGDDFYGERCELGRNDHRTGPTALYEEGERWITYLSVRLPRSFRLGSDTWQGVLQMKQTQPAAGGGGPPALSLSAFGGRWMLSHSLPQAGVEGGMEQLWSAAARRRTWTRIKLDVLYSRDPERGWVRVAIDRNGDGDTADPRERSPLFRTFTLKREIAGGGEDSIAEGESIPSHLRVGIYHDPAIACPPPRGCALDIDNVQALRVDER